MHYFKDLEAQGQNLLKDIEQNIELGELIVNSLFTAMLCLVYEDLNSCLPLSIRLSCILKSQNAFLRDFAKSKGCLTIMTTYLKFLKKSWDNWEVQP